MTLNKLQKTAIFLISLGVDNATKILQNMPFDDAKKIIEEITKWEVVPFNLMKQVVEEMSSQFQVLNFKGGKKYAEELLIRISPKLYIEKTRENKSNSKLDKIDPEKFIEIIKKEHPQTAAFILINLSPDLSSEIIKKLPLELQLEISKRISLFNEVKLDTLKMLEEIIEEKYPFFFNTQKDTKPINAINTMANILNQLDPEIKNNILSHFERELPEELINNLKDQMFTFDDIVYLLDTEVQLIIQNVKMGDLAVCLKLANEATKEKIFKNMSSRAAEILKEEIQSLPPMRLSDARAIQRGVLHKIKELANEGKILLTKNNEPIV